MSTTHADEFEVVVNEEEQYSIWPTHKQIPLGWKAAGKRGQKQECLDYINTIWVDMTPRSLRGNEAPR